MKAAGSSAGIVARMLALKPAGAFKQSIGFIQG